VGSSESINPQTPLSGIRVVDFTQAVYGAGAAQILGDMGADVIKIEPPWGEFMRWGQSRHRPGEHGERQSDDVPEDATWLAMNRNKRSLSIDLREERGREIVKRLIAHADIVIHNYRADVMSRMGLGYEDAKALNDKIVYVEMSAFGSEGPMRRWAGGDMWAQAIGGSVSVQGEPDSPPCMVNVPLGDQSGALIGALSALAALTNRTRTGESQYVTTSLLDAVLSMQSSQIADYLIDDRLIGQGGRGWRGAFPHGAYQASDGAVAILNGESDEDWRTLCGLLGLTDLLDDDRYQTSQQRADGRKELYPLMDAAFGAHTRQEWQEIFHKAHLRCDPCLNYSEIPVHPQVVENGHINTMDHPTLGALRFVAQPFRLNGSRGATPNPPPKLGQHTRDILREVGLDEGDIEALAADSIVVLQQ
jgi:crotonobetainyl-CoA:carnitine CoA-transferase CaiB-like acyl-CoA transferase